MIIFIIIIIIIAKMIKIIKISMIIFINIISIIKISMVIIIIIIIIIIISVCRRVTQTLSNYLSTRAQPPYGLPTNKSPSQTCIHSRIYTTIPTT